MSAVSPSPTVKDVFVQAIAEQDEQIPDDVARYLAEFRLPESQQRRVKQLSEKNRGDTLSPDEDRELQAYREVIGVFQFLKAKAIRTLGENPAG